MTVLTGSRTYLSGLPVEFPRCRCHIHPSQAAGTAQPVQLSYRRVAKKAWLGVLSIWATLLPSVMALRTRLQTVGHCTLDYALQQVKNVQHILGQWTFISAVIRSKILELYDGEMLSRISVMCEFRVARLDLLWQRAQHMAGRCEMQLHEALTVHAQPARADFVVPPSACHVYISSL